MRPGQCEQAAVGQFLVYQEVRQVPPAEALEDHLFLRSLVRHAALSRAGEHEIVRRRRMAGAVAHHTLGEGAQLFRAHRSRRRIAEQARRDDRDQPDPAQVEPFQAWVGLVHAMQDQVGLAVQQALQRAADGFEQQLQAGLRLAAEEPCEQRQGRARRAEVAQYHAQLAFLALGQVRGVAPQPFQFVEQGLGTLVEGATGGGQADPVAASFQQHQAELALQPGNGGEHRRMGAVQALCGGLEAAGVDHCVEALEVVEGEIVHVSFPDRVVPFFVVFPRGRRN